MKNAVLISLVALVFGLLGGWLGGRFGAAEPVAAAPAPQGIEPDAKLSGALVAIDRRTAAVERAVEELRLSVADMSASAARSAVERGPRAADPLAATSETLAAAEGTAPAAGVSAQAAIDTLLGGEIAWDKAQALWKEVEKAGRLDELVRLFEERAAARGNDPDAQTELGEAYLQKVFRAGAGPDAGVWATKADRAFDAALAIDDHHWQARFQKAVSLSFWPPVFGKQAEAIKHFETLAAQQESQTKHTGMAQTYLLMGNLHQQMGASDKAIATWQKGLSMFPGNAELAQKIQDAQAH